MTPIDDADDPRIAAYRAVRDRDRARGDGSFLVEGEVVLRVLVSNRSRYRPSSLLLSESRAGPLASVLDALSTEVAVYVANQAVMDRIVGFPIHRGVLACARRGPTAEPNHLLAHAGRLAVGLIGLANHDNVGGAFRNAAAFGVGAVLLDDATCDPLYRKAIRVSAGACLTVPFARGGSAGAMVASLVQAGFEPLALSPAGREPLPSVAWPARAALLVGSEGAGLPAEILAGCRTVRIDMAPGQDSLNVATATGVALAYAHGGRPPSDDGRGD